MRNQQDYPLTSKLPTILEDLTINDTRNLDRQEKDYSEEVVKGYKVEIKEPEYKHSRVASSLAANSPAKNVSLPLSKAPSIKLSVNNSPTRQPSII